tara:strand:+ start:2705 stop:3157 length:453 start_codon:yes stop_codon:yes gene_type:complete
VIGEVAAVLSALKALNDGIQTIKQSAGNASDLQSIVGRFAGAQEKYNEVEKAKTGRMSYKEALAMESAKRQLINFDRQLKDICLMQGQGDLYNSIKKRMEEARLAHEKEVARLRIRRKELQKYLSWAMMGGVTWIFGMGILWLILAIFRV